MLWQLLAIGASLPRDVALLLELSEKEAAGQLRGLLRQLYQGKVTGAAASFGQTVQAMDALQQLLEILRSLQGTSYILEDTLAGVAEMCDVTVALLHEVDDDHINVSFYGGEPCAFKPGLSQQLSCTDTLAVVVS